MSADTLRSCYRSVSILALTVVASAGSLALCGGCPGSQPSDDGTGGDAVVAGIVDALANGTFVAPSFHIGTLQSQPVSGVFPGIEADGLELVIIAPPTVGDLQIATSASAFSYTYSPGDDFVGDTTFQYLVRFGEFESNVASVQISVYPQVAFLVEPREGERDLTVTSVASTIDGRPLPPGTYTWNFGGAEVADDVNHPGQASYTFRTGGRHTVALLLTLAGIAQPVHCAAVDADGQYVSVAPQIAGRVTHADGSPAGNLRVRTSDASRSALTSDQGEYVMTVPLNWSGSIWPETSSVSQPTERVYSNVTGDASSQNFALGSLSGGENPDDPGDPQQPTVPPTANSQAVQTDEDTAVTIALTATGGGTLAFAISALPARGSLADPVNSHTIFGNELPYVLQSAQVRFTPHANLNGTDSFRFRASNSAGSSDEAAVALTINPVNDPPTINGTCPMSLVVDENSSSSDPENQMALSAIDPDASGATLVWTIVTQPTNGSATLTGSPSSSGGSVTLRYGPNASYSGVDPIVISVRDASNATTTCTINAVVGGYPYSGTVRNHAGAAASGVPLVLTGSGASSGINFSLATDGAGGYVAALPVGWSGTVTSTQDYRLDPVSRTITNTSGPATNQDFTRFRNYYVATTGNNSGSGTFAAPYLTPQKGVDMLAPGDTLYIRGGVYQPAAGNANNRVVRRTGLAGTAQFPITITAYAAEEVIFDGDVGTGCYTGFELFNPTWVTISKIKLRKFRSTALDLGARAGQGSMNNVTIEYCEVYELHPNNTTWNPGIQIHGPAQYCTIRKCVVRNYSGGIALWEYPAQNYTTAAVPPVAGNSAPGSPSGGYTADMPESDWDSWPGWIELAPRYCTIEDCLSYDNVSVNPENSDGFITRYAVECTVRNNIGWGNPDDNYDMAGATRIQFYGNIAFNAPGANGGDGNGIKIGVRGGLDCVVHHNVSFGNNRIGIDMADTERPRVYNNTCFNQHGHNGGNSYGIWFEARRASTGGIIAVNNIMANNQHGDMMKDLLAHHVQIDYNCLSDAGSGTYGAPQGTHTLRSTNPLFLNPSATVDTTFQAGWTMEQKLAHIRGQVDAMFGLQNSSPCIDAGVTVSGVTDGHQGPAPDMGRYEMR
ncbi:MAG: hypothetical protein JNG88_10395 [Phycisphaerales bacterium]|nr:hypothetical protein [Phycisphaerales bacterium]